MSGRAGIVKVSTNYWMKFLQIFYPSKFITFFFDFFTCLRTELMQRSIYTDEQLSVQKYLSERNKLKMTMQSSFVEIKKKQLRKHLQQSSQQSAPPPWLLANDFIQFLHLIDNTDADIRLLEQLMDVFKLIDVRNLRNINIGSILMKMLHHFKRDATAQKVREKKHKIGPNFNKKFTQFSLFHLIAISVLQRSSGAAKFPNGQTEQFNLFGLIVQAEKICGFIGTIRCSKGVFKF